MPRKPFKYDVFAPGVTCARDGRPIKANVALRKTRRPLLCYRCWEIAVLAPRRSGKAPHAIARRAASG